MIFTYEKAIPDKQHDFFHLIHTRILELDSSYVKLKELQEFLIRQVPVFKYRLYGSWNSSSDVDQYSEGNKIVLYLLPVSVLCAIINWTLSIRCQISVSKTTTERVFNSLFFPLVYIYLIFWVCQHSSTFYFQSLQDKWSH